MSPNLSISSTVDKEIKEIVTAQFGTYSVSIGALLRKLPYLLMHLARICNIVCVKGNWHNDFYRFTVYDPDKEEIILTVDYRFDNANGVKMFTHILKKDTVSKNKWMNEQYSYCKIKFNTSIGKFSYGINLNDPMEPVFIMHKESLNVSEHLALFIRQLMVKNMEIKILNYEVVNYTLRSQYEK